MDAAIAATSLRSKDLLGIEELTPEEILLVLDTAEAMKEVGQRQIKKVPALHGRTVVNLFYEPSTRTRTSFEIAEKRLSADILGVAIASSSVVKGETLVDTARNIEAMGPSMIVLRHPSSGAAHLLARVCKSPIINAGDGLHEHPTQALLDAFTIRERKGRLKGLKVAIVGDLKYGRTVHSLIRLLSLYRGLKFTLVAPATLEMPGYLVELATNHGHVVEQTSSLQSGLRGADVGPDVAVAVAPGRGVDAEHVAARRGDGGAGGPAQTAGVEEAGIDLVLFEIPAVRKLYIGHEAGILQRQMPGNARIGQRRGNRQVAVISRAIAISGQDAKNFAG